MTTQTNQSLFPLPLLTTDDAPPAARELLGTARSRFGFVPNLLGVMANAPALLKGYLVLAAAFEKPSSRRRSGRSSCWRRASSTAASTAWRRTRRSRACRRSRRTSSRRCARTDRSPTRSCRRCASSPPRWSAPAAGHRPRSRLVSPGAGYRPAQALDVVLGIGVKTLSNYCNHLAATPLDDAFAVARWSPRATGEQTSADRHRER